MNRAFCRLLCLAWTVLAVSSLSANPIALRPRVCRLKAEEVTLQVRQRDSLVTGDYLFETVGPVPDPTDGYHVALELPVPLPARLEDLDDQTAVAKPSIRVGKSRYGAVRLQSRPLRGARTAAGRSRSQAGPNATR